jgi:hypothetical protein
LRETHMYFALMAVAAQDKSSRFGPGVVFAVVLVVILEFDLSHRVSGIAAKPTRPFGLSELSGSKAMKHLLVLCHAL